jgi:Protein of unknown function (DUF3035)
LAVAGIALVLLSACGRNDSPPSLMNIRSTDGPDEFGIVPPKALSLPESLTELPEPAPGGTNLTDPTPNDDAVAALGGRPGAGAAGDAGLIGHVSRYGVAADIRPTLAAADLEFRSRNRGRPLERLFNRNVYFRAYEGLSLNQQRELERWRAAGVRTVSAPPPKR